MTSRRRVYGPIGGADRHAPRGTVVLAERECIEQCERSSRPLYFGNGNSTVKCDDVARRQREKLIVERHDLPPVRVGGGRGIAVHGIDRRLNLIRTGPIESQTLAYETLRLRDGVAIPEAAILIDEAHELAALREPCRST